MHAQGAVQHEKYVVRSLKAMKILDVYSRDERVYLDDLTKEPASTNRRSSES
jgi:hypothetical protein